MANKPKGRERFCFNCGESLGIYADYDPLDTCGKTACEREARESYREEREDKGRNIHDRGGWQ